MPKLRGISGEIAIKKIGTVIPLHDEIKIRTLKSILNLAKVNPEEFADFL